MKRELGGWFVGGFDGLTTTSPVEIVPEVEVSKHKTCFCVHPGDNKEYNGIALTLTRNASSLSQFQTDSQSTKHCNNPSKKIGNLVFLTILVFISWPNNCDLSTKQKTSSPSSLSHRSFSNRKNMTRCFIVRGWRYRCRWLPMTRRMLRAVRRREIWNKKGDVDVRQIQCIVRKEILGSILVSSKPLAQR